MSGRWRYWDLKCTVMAWTVEALEVLETVRVKMEIIIISLSNNSDLQRME